MNIDLIISWLSMAIGFGSILAIASLGELLTEKVGHLNLGAGRVVYQDLLRITRDIEDGKVAVGIPAKVIRENI